MLLLQASAHYFVASQGEAVFFLDPHTQRDRVDLDPVCVSLSLSLFQSESLSLCLSLMLNVCICICNSL